jgi:hypothetical protein
VLALVVVAVVLSWTLEPPLQNGLLKAAPASTSHSSTRGPGLLEGEQSRRPSADSESAPALANSPTAEASTVEFRVVDQDSGRPLSDALAAESIGGMRAVLEVSPHQIPRPDAIRENPERADAQGHIKLRVAKSEWTGYVRSPGYAWTKVSLPVPSAGHVVALECGGALKLAVRDWRRLYEPAVWVRYSDGQSVLLPPPTMDGTLYVDGVRCGDHHVELRRGQRLTGSVVYARQRVSIQSGSTTEVLITVPDLGKEAPEVQKLRGQLVIEAGWPSGYSDRVLMRLEGAGDDNAQAAETLVFKNVVVDVPIPFETSTPLPVGRYRVSIRPFGYESVHVFGASRAGPELRVSGGVLVRVRLIGLETAKLSSARVSWRHVHGEGEDKGGGLQRASFEADTGTFNFRAPPGRVRVRVSGDGIRQVDDGYLRVGQERDQTNEIEVVLAGILLVNVHAGAEIVFAEVDARLLPGELGPSARTSDGVAAFRDLPAGRYRVLVSVPAGYKDPDPREVTVRDGETVRLDVNVERGKK